MNGLGLRKIFEEKSKEYMGIMDLCIENIVIKDSKIIMYFEFEGNIQYLTYFFYSKGYVFSSKYSVLDLEGFQKCIRECSCLVDYCVGIYEIMGVKND